MLDFPEEERDNDFNQVDTDSTRDKADTSNNDIPNVSSPKKDDKDKANDG